MKPVPVMIMRATAKLLEGVKRSEVRREAKLLERTSKSGREPFVRAVVCVRRSCAS